MIAATKITNPLEADKEAAWEEMCNRYFWVRQVNAEMARAIFDIGFVSGIERGVELTKGIYQR